MAKFPEPPAADVLRAVESDILVLRTGTKIWRVYFRGGPHPTLWNGFRSFGPTTARFDHHLPPPSLQARKILDAATHGVTSLAEIFQETRVIDRCRRSPWIAGIHVRRGIRLLDRTRTWPTRAGASMAIATGPRPRARRWARTIYESYPQIEGLWYPSSMHANHPCVALFERAEGSLDVLPAFHRPLDDPALLIPLKNAARLLGYGLV